MRVERSGQPIELNPVAVTVGAAFITELGKHPKALTDCRLRKKLNPERELVARVSAISGGHGTGADHRVYANDPTLIFPERRSR